MPEEILPATPSTSSDEERSLSSLEVGMEEEMEPIKEEPEAEAKEELEDSRHDVMTELFFVSIFFMLLSSSRSKNVSTHRLLLLLFTSSSLFSLFSTPS